MRDLLAGQGDFAGRALVPARGRPGQARHRVAGARQPDRMGQRDPVRPVRLGPLAGPLMPWTRSPSWVHAPRSLTAGLAYIFAGIWAVPLILGPQTKFVVFFSV